MLVYGLPLDFVGLAAAPSLLGEPHARCGTTATQNGSTVHSVQEVSPRPPKELSALIKLNSVPLGNAAPLFLIPGIHMYGVQ